MSLSNVLLLHVSTAFLPQNDAEREAEQEEEHYHTLGLPQYSSSDDIRRAYRRASLKLQCDRMMLEWQQSSSSSSDRQNQQKQKKCLEEREQKLQKAYRVLGDRHLRQQYHLLQCRPCRSKIIQGPLAFHTRWTHTRRRFPFVVLQSVLIAAMVNATVAHVETENWVLVLIPTWVYYGVTVLFWWAMFAKVLVRWRQCTARSLVAMFAAFAQHALAWLGLFYMARYWDRDIIVVNTTMMNWFFISIPFYLAVAFRCYCTWEAIRSLRELQSKMISRNRFEKLQAAQKTKRQHTQQPSQNNNNNDDNNHNSTSDDNDNDFTSMESSNHLCEEGYKTNPNKNNNSTAPLLPDDFIVVKLENSAFLDHIYKLFLTDDELTQAISNPQTLEECCIQSSPEYRQVNAAVVSLRKSILKVAFTSIVFITLTTLKLEGYLPVSFWIVFLPVWIVLGLEVIGATPRRGRLRRNQRHPQTSPQARQAALMEVLEHDDSSKQNKNSVNNNEDTTTTGEVIHDKIIPATNTDTTPEYDVEAPEPVIRISSLGSGGASKTTSESTSQTEFNNKSNQDETNSNNQPSLIVWSGETQGVTSTTKERPTPDNDVEHDDHDDSGNETGGGTAVVHEEFERWQSVYESTDATGLQFRYIPFQAMFQILILCLIVVKLDKNYGNDDPNDVGFDAFLVILVPFSVGLALCCCAIMAGCVELAREETNNNASRQDTANTTQISSLPHSENSNNATDGETPPTEELPPMQAGAQNLRGITFSEHIVVSLSNFAPSHKIQLLTSVLQISNADAEAWVLTNTKDTFLWGLDTTLWEIITACADDLDCHSVNYEKATLSEGDFPYMSNEWWTLLRKNLEAYFDRTRFQSDIDAIRPLEYDDNDGSATESPAGMECPICCEDYSITDMVPCEGDPIHFFCRICFHRYATETLESSGGVTGMPCADSKCQATFATPTVRSNLSAWDLLRMEERQDELDTKVALAAKAVLKCTCGSVAIVMEGEMGDGCIQCPGPSCGLEFCAKCGNKWHPDADCPPTKRTLAWICKNAMPCPNCHTPIEKNAGCDHMWCAPPGGCGHHFSYRTGKPMSKSGRNLPGIYH